MVPNSKRHAGLARTPSVMGPESFPRMPSASRLPLRRRQQTLPRFPEVHHPIAVLLPESFRGGCSFGGIPPSNLRGRSALPRGIVCWPSRRAIRRTGLLQSIIRGVGNESTKARKPPDLLTFFRELRCPKGPKPRSKPPKPGCKAPAGRPADGRPARTGHGARHRSG